MTLTTEQQQAYSYILGQYLGDGHINKEPRTFRFRIFSDYKYPKLVDEIKKNLSILFPKNKVNSLIRLNKGNPSWITTYVYSNSIHALFPQHGPGPKHTRKIILELWQKDIVNSFQQEFLRGLYHSDGSRYLSDGKYVCYNFTNCSKDIIKLFQDSLSVCDIQYTTRYDIPTGYTPSNVVNVYRQAEVAKLDLFLGPKT